jgi:hypothetical protein
LWKWSAKTVLMVSGKKTFSDNPEANIYPLHMHPQYYLKRRWQELKTEFLTCHLDYVRLTLDTAARGCGLSPAGVRVWQRALELLAEAKERLAEEFNQGFPRGEVS